MPVAPLIPDDGDPKAAAGLGVSLAGLRALRAALEAEYGKERLATMSTAEVAERCVWVWPSGRREHRLVCGHQVLGTWVRLAAMSTAAVVETCVWVGVVGVGGMVGGAVAVGAEEVL